MVTSGPCFRNNCDGTMKLDDGIFICDACGLSSRYEDYVYWLENGGDDDALDDDYEDVPGYEEYYDDDGNYIYCEDCDVPLKERIDDGKIVCPRCGKIIF